MALTGTTAVRPFKIERRKVQGFDRCYKMYPDGAEGLASGEDIAVGDYCDALEAENQELKAATAANAVKPPRKAG